MRYLLPLILLLPGCFDVCDQACDAHADYLVNCGLWSAARPTCYGEPCTTPGEWADYCRDAWDATMEAQTPGYLDLARNACERTLLVVDEYGECSGVDDPLTWFDVP